MCLRLENGGSDCDDEIPQKLSDCYASGNTYLDSLPKLSSRQGNQLGRSGQKSRFTNSAKYLIFTINPHPPVAQKIKDEVVF